MDTPTLKYGFVGAGFIARFQLAALRQLRGHRGGRRHVDGRRAGLRDAGGRLGPGRDEGLRHRGRAGEARRLRGHLRPQLRAGRGGRSHRRRRQGRGEAEGRHLREAAGPQHGRGAAPGRTRPVGRPANGVLREPDLHEARPGPAGAARAGAAADGAAGARQVGRGARRASRRLVLGPDQAGRRRALRHGVPQHRGGMVRPDAGRQADHVSRARRRSRRISGCSSGGCRPGARSC